MGLPETEPPNKEDKRDGPRSPSTCVADCCSSAFTLVLNKWGRSYSKSCCLFVEFVLLPGLPCLTQWERMHLAPQRLDMPGLGIPSRDSGAVVVGDLLRREKEEREIVVGRDQEAGH